jgi:hypothetical protein
MHFSTKAYVRAEAQRWEFGVVFAWHDPVMPHIRNGRCNATTRSAPLCPSSDVAAVTPCGERDWTRPFGSSDWSSGPTNSLRIDRT